jgi:hypothetical protein
MLQPRGPLAIALRDVVLRVPVSWAAGSQGWLYRYDSAAAVG